MKRNLALLALLALSSFAQDVAPAPEDSVASAATSASNTVSAAETPVAPRPRVRPGPANRAMTPEMKAYVDRLDAIRAARDEQARAAAQAVRDIEARKTALADENEEVKKLVDKVAELRDALSVAEKSLAEFYAADEALVALENKKADAEKERDAKQSEMHAAVAAAMDERAARFRPPQGAPVFPAAHGKAAPSPAPAPASPAPAPAPAE